MRCPYELPEKRPDESNDEWCRRAAESIPADALMRQLVDYLMTRKRNSGGHLKGAGGWDPAWSFVSHFTGHGSGVSGAIVRRFLQPKEDLDA